MKKNIKDIEINATRLGGQLSSAYARYFHGPDYDLNSIPYDCGFFGFPNQAVNTADRHFPLQTAGSVMKSTMSGSYFGEIFISSIGRMFFRSAKSDSDNSTWKELVTLDTLSTLSLEEFKALKNAAIEIKNNNMQLTDLQSKMGGCIEKIPIPDSPFIVTVRQKGGQRNEEKHKGYNENRRLRSFKNDYLPTCERTDGFHSIRLKGRFLDSNSCDRSFMCRVTTGSTHSRNHGDISQFGTTSNQKIFSFLIEPNIRSDKRRLGSTTVGKGELLIKSSRKEVVAV